MQSSSVFLFDRSTQRATRIGDYTNVSDAKVLISGLYNFDPHTMVISSRWIISIYMHTTERGRAHSVVASNAFRYCLELILLKQFLLATTLCSFSMVNKWTFDTQIRATNFTTQVLAVKSPTPNGIMSMYTELRIYYFTQWHHFTGYGLLNLYNV